MLLLKKYEIFHNERKYELDMREIKRGTISSLLEDSKGRDFNINALYYDFVNDVVYDDFSTLDTDEECESIREIQSKVITWNRYQRKKIFNDPTRFLRAIRFKNKLNFQLSNQLEKYMKIYAPSILSGYQKKMRIINEVNKMMKRDYFIGCVLDLIDFGILETFLKKVSRVNSYRYIRSFLSMPEDYKFKYEIKPFKINKSMILFMNIQKFLTKKVKELKIKEPRDKLRLVLKMENELRMFFLLGLCCKDPDDFETNAADYVLHSNHFFVLFFHKISD